jgi:hypothetical protein
MFHTGNPMADMNSIETSPPEVFHASHSRLLPQLFFLLTMGNGQVVRIANANHQSVTLSAVVQWVVAARPTSCANSWLIPFRTV